MPGLIRRNQQGKRTLAVLSEVSCKSERLQPSGRTGGASEDAPQEYA